MLVIWFIDIEEENFAYMKIFFRVTLKLSVPVKPTFPHADPNPNQVIMPVDLWASGRHWDHEAEAHSHPPEQDWSHQGGTGQFIPLIESKEYRAGVILDLENKVGVGE